MTVLEGASDLAFSRGQRLLLAGLWLSVIASVSAALVLWPGNRMWNETVVTSAPKHGMATIEDRPVAIEWIERHPRNELLWQLLLLGWFYPGKILLQVSVRDRGRQLLWYAGLVLVATVWVWYRLTTWDWWWCETIYSKMIGEPVGYLFVPSAFFLFDWSTGRQRGVGLLLLRMPLELLILIPWAFVWGFLQLMLGWLWI